ncbi:hypothetical protein KFL_010210010, partial [Klebsormidium nitens]
MKGYLVSCGVPKNKQRRQILCLGCVGKLMGDLKVSADAESVSLCKHDALLFERQASGSWRQKLELTNELLEAVVISNESTPEERLGIPAQAGLFLSGVLEGTCRIVVPAGVDACAPGPLRLYMTHWDHNRARPKALGKPSKEKALLEECWWDSQGYSNCSCDRGRLARDAPCVHKLVLAALRSTGLQQGDLPTARELGRGAGLVEQVGTDSTGRFFAVRSSPKGVSPAHKMLHRSVDGDWYCQGKRDGCPSQHDCSHILAANLAVRAGQVHFAQGLLLGQDALSTARQWLERWDGALGRGEGGSESRSSSEGASEEEAHLMGLISGQRHEPAGCAGADCFCREHQQLFGVAEPTASAPQGLSVSEPWTGARRSKQWYRSHAGGAPLIVAPQSVREPPMEALGKEAIRCWVSSCGNCTLEGAQRGCQHEGKGRAPVMLQETQAVQVTQPKLSQLSDAPDFHDPWVMRLRCGPIRVSKLVGRDFHELGDLGMLSAPCPLEPPLCGGEWAGLWQDALLLKQMQRGQSGFGALLEGQQEALWRAPECAVLSEETWRKASLDFFRLVGRQLLECCSICGPHPEVLLCDGIVGIANSDGGKRPGGLGSTSHDFRRPFTHPGRSADGAALEKQSVAGRDYCAAGLEGGGMKRRLVLQPELRELIARVSRHRPVSEKLGQPLSEAEYLGLKEALGREDVLLVTRFIPGDGEGPVPADTRRRLLVEQRQMVRDKNRAMLRLLEGIELEQAARGGSPRLWEHWPCEWGELLYDLGAHDSDDGIIGHSDGLAV